MPQFPTSSTSRPAAGELISAVIRNNMQLVRQLLDQKADINEKDKDGNTALNHAADLGYIEIVRLLVDKGADLNMKNADGDTPLMKALSAYSPYTYNNDNYNTIARLLINHGADLDAKNKSGETALSIATNKSREQIIVLIKDEKIRRTKLAEEYARAAEKKRRDVIADKQQELREAAKKKPKLKPFPPKAA